MYTSRIVGKIHEICGDAVNFNHVPNSKKQSIMVLYSCVMFDVFYWDVTKLVIFNWYVRLNYSEVVRVVVLETLYMKSLIF